MALSGLDNQQYYYHPETIFPLLNRLRGDGGLWLGQTSSSSARGDDYASLVLVPVICSARAGSSNDSNINLLLDV